MKHNGPLSVRRAILGAVLLAASVSTGCQKQASQTSHENDQTSTPNDAVTDTFQSVTEAARQAFVTAPTNEQQMQDMYASEQRAASYFAAHPDEASDEVLGRLEKTSAADTREWQIGCHWLSQIGGARVIEFLYERAATNITPEPNADGVDPRLLVQGYQVQAIARLATLGDDLANQRLLDVIATTTTPGLRVMAIGAYYAASPDRWRAKQALLARLDPSEHYLLHGTF